MKGSKYHHFYQKNIFSSKKENMRIQRANRTFDKLKTNKIAFDKNTLQIDFIANTTKNQTACQKGKFKWRDRSGPVHKSGRTMTEINREYLETESRLIGNCNDSELPAPMVKFPTTTKNKKKSPIPNSQIRRNRKIKVKKVLREFIFRKYLA